MIKTLSKNWWLIALCGAIDAVISAIYLIMQATDGPVVVHTWSGTVVFVGKLAMGAGVCAIAAGLWRSRNGKCWLLALNGVLLCTLGFIQYGLTRFRISILNFALLIVLMAISIGIVELAIARTLGRQNHVGDGWFFGMAGIGSVGFVLPFLALGFRWIALEPGSHVDLLWLGFYFGFSAVCMLALALRLHGNAFYLAERSRPI